MLKSVRGKVSVTIVLFWLLLLAGCASTPPSQFYTLSSLGVQEEQSALEGGGSGISIGVGPLSLPDQLDREQIVTRTSPNTVDLAEFDRWAGSLKDDLLRVIGENLSALLSTDQVHTYPWRRSAPIQYQVVIEILRFEGTLGRSALLKARWTIFSYKDKEVLITRSSAMSEAMSGSGYEDLVASQSKLVASLCRLISREIKSHSTDTLSSPGGG
jgi:uncharacterized lipoprotein YmbA